MIGIYQDSFIDYLKTYCGDNKVKVTSKNITIPCPYCEYGKDKDHYHLNIAIDAPIFHCFHATCEKGGNLRTLLKKIEGTDISDRFVDKNEFKKIAQREIFVDREKTKKKLFLPEIDKDKFPYKELYLQKRFRFSNQNSETIKGLIYDVDEFINTNNIPVDETLFRMRDYLHSNFIGFLTEHHSQVIFRNIDSESKFRYFKLTIQNDTFLDYYKLKGNDPLSNKIVLAEGVFDIFSSQLFDHLNIKDKVRLFASSLSSNYIALIRSIIFNESVFKPDIIILSDNGIPIEKYKKMKFFNNYMINSLTVYFNKYGKDFDTVPIIPIQYSI